MGLLERGNLRTVVKILNKIRVSYFFQFLDFKIISQAWCCHLHSNCSIAMQLQIVALAHLWSQCTRFHAASWACRLVVFFYLESGRLCGLVVRVLGYRSGGPGSIPGTSRKN
jgi:hypothetical protein